MRIIGTVSLREIYLKIPVLFHVWHSSVFFFFLPHYIYVEFFGVFELFSPVHSKTPKQWKSNGNTRRCMISSFSTTSVSSVHTKTKSWCLFSNPTLGTVFNARKYRLHFSGRKAKRRKEIRPFSKIPGYMWTRPKVSL